MFFEENYRVIEILMWLFGIVVAINCYGDYLNRRQHEAVFGFYVNLRVYLERINVFLGENFNEAIVLSRMYTKTANKTESARDVPSDELVFAFVQLSKEFLNFLSISKDNIPPKKGKEDFIGWFEHQVVLVRFLQKGASLSNLSYGQYSNEKALNNDCILRRKRVLPHN